MLKNLKKNFQKSVKKAFLEPTNFPDEKTDENT